MNLPQWALPAGLAVVGIGALVAAVIVIRRNSGHQVTAKERAELDLERRQAWRRRLAVIALAIGCLMMFLLAGIAAWLSFGAQREYAHAHNGGDWDAATGFAMLLDAGALSLSLIRFFEALTVRSSGLTRLLLFLFVASSAQMNLLHAPESGAGGAFLAVVPPLVYAVLLEMLLVKVEQVITGRNKQSKPDHERGYSLLLWLPWPIGAPVQMWKAWRSELLATIDNVRVLGSRRPLAPTAGPVLEEPASLEPVELASVEPAQPPVMLEKPVPAQLPEHRRPAPDEVPFPSMPVRGAAAPEPDGPAVPAAVASSTPAPAPVPVPVSAPDAGPAGSGPGGLPAEEAPQGEPEEDTVSPASPADQPVEAEGAEAEPAAVPDTGEAEGAEAPEEGPDRAEEAGQAGYHTGDDLEAGTQPAASEGGEPEKPRQAEEDAAPGEGEAAAEESEIRHERPGPEADGNEETRERQRVQIDLSTLPKDEGPRQLAERIYVAHLVAGLPLDKGDLAKWAGYKSPRSGGNEYRRLVKVHGPILEREGAGYLDLDWSSIEQHGDPVTAQTL
ncbi:DUF2637 domain-containing protein [Streptomyces sp. NPDC001407]|uniref:DUF2637 domain-containing protein n=1 Tax=Streptomyces sp. NPDC001407 TaxID=3364573 RepID=UPI0036B9F08D